MSERIISLTSENIKRLRAIHITPNGQSVEIAGRNGAGKSSVLDSIWYALAGRSVLPDRPIRDGESRAEVTVELENYTVTRSFTAAGGGTLKVTPKSSPGDGKPIPSPQAFLDGLLTTLTFDPFEFTRLKDSEQGETLRKLLGLDFLSMDNQSLQFYIQRTEVNRTAAQLSAKLAGTQPHPVTSDEPVVLADVLAARGAAIAHNKENQTKKDQLLEMGFKQDRFEATADSLKNEIHELERQIKSKQEKHAEIVLQAADHLRQMEMFGAVVRGLQDKDLSVFDAQILAAESHNARLAQNRDRSYTATKLAEAQVESADLTARIDGIAKQKSDALAAAKFPLLGLSFSSSGGVAFNGVPFGQISTAEQIRVSTAIGLSLNPGLKVIFIRNGSLIDAAGIRTLCELAQLHGAQIWIERVGVLSGELPGVVIEDGAVSESTIIERVESGALSGDADLTYTQK